MKQINKARPFRPAARRAGLLAAGGALAMFVCGQASAVELSGNNWSVDVGGFINAFYTTTNCTGRQVGGIALAGHALGCGGQSSRTTIGNGLLPSALITKFKTQQEGYDIGGTIGIMVHAATSSSIAPNSGVDVRQAFFTVGTPDMGTFKLGRDYGIYGSNAILTDMTLLGVGMPVQSTQRGRVSLGHIGAGYSWLGNYGQIVYTTTGTSGFIFTGGLMSPVDVDTSTTPITTHYVSKSGPQVQAQLSWNNDIFKAWVGAKAQRFHAPEGESAGFSPSDFTMAAGELGASFNEGPWGVLANVQAGKGLGILSDGDQGDTKSINYLVQGTYKITEKVKLGVNYGVSRNRDETPFTYGVPLSINNPLISGLGLKQNSNVTAGAYWSLTKSVTLAFELSQTRSEAFDGDTAKMNGVSVGGIVFF